MLLERRPARAGSGLPVSGLVAPRQPVPRRHAALHAAAPPAARGARRCPSSRRAATSPTSRSAPTSARRSRGWPASPTCSWCTTGRSRGTWTTRSSRVVLGPRARAAPRPRLRAPARWSSAGLPKSDPRGRAAPEEHRGPVGRRERLRRASTSATWRPPRRMPPSSMRSSRSSGCTTPPRPSSPATSTPTTCRPASPARRRAPGSKCSITSRT